LFGFDLVACEPHRLCADETTQVWLTAASQRPCQRTSPGAPKLINSREQRKKSPQKVFWSILASSPE
jgi:hypothetical protein